MRYCFFILKKNLIFKFEITTLGMATYFDHGTHPKAKQLSQICKKITFKLSCIT